MSAKSEDALPHLCRHRPFPEDDHHALAIARRIVDNLNIEKQTPVTTTQADIEAPLYDAGIESTLPCDLKKTRCSTGHCSYCRLCSRFDVFKKM